VNRRPVLAGMVLVTLGVILLLDELGSLDAGDLLSTWWPLVVIAAGVVQLTVQPRSTLGGVLLVGVGSVLLLWRLEVVDDLSLLWPALLLTLGGWLLLGHGRRRHTIIRAGGVEFGDEIGVVTVFNDRRATLAPGAFAGGSIVTVFGDVELDLTAGTPAPVARLDGVTVFGDVDLLVPDDWRVTMTGPTLFGDVRIDERPVGAATGEQTPELRLELVTVFGDVRVRRAHVAAGAGA
jgi:predicted membrane protein